MKYLFGVQTEGQGHTVQAIAIKEFLENRGDIVVGALASEKDRGFSDFFRSEFNIFPYSGFDFVFDKSGKLILTSTIKKNLLKLPALTSSFVRVCRKIKEENPDVICNFYDPLVGLTALLFPNIQYISFGHQYAMTTPEYPEIKGFIVQKMFLRILNAITSIRAKKIALSYYPFKSEEAIVCPPILRAETYKKSDIQDDFVLVYLMNENLVNKFLNYARNYPDLIFHVYTKINNRKIETDKNVLIFDLDGKTFQEKMKICSAVICSGGFETSSEAIYHGKPLFMVPIENHYEQFANCNDAAAHGFATWHFEYDPSNSIPTNQLGNSDWFNQKDKILEQIFS